MVDVVFCSSGDADDYHGFSRGWISTSVLMSGEGQAFRQYCGDLRCDCFGDAKLTMSSSILLGAAAHEILAVRLFELPVPHWDC
jgi:hypothetical protein